jgi:hypothetical protein
LPSLARSYDIFFVKNDTAALSDKLEWSWLGKRDDLFIDNSLGDLFVFSETVPSLEKSLRTLLKNCLKFLHIDFIPSPRVRFDKSSPRIV